MRSSTHRPILDLPYDRFKVALSHRPLCQSERSSTNRRLQGDGIDYSQPTLPTPQVHLIRCISSAMQQRCKQVRIRNTVFFSSNRLDRRGLDSLTRSWLMQRGVETKRERETREVRSVCLARLQFLRNLPVLHRSRKSSHKSHFDF